MLRNLFGNMPPVVKNLVLLNVLMFVATLIGQWQGFDLNHILGGYVFNSPYFQPYQIVTSCFMHGGFFHIFFNMFALIIFGPTLEQAWGPKRFFIFYFVCAIGAFVFYEIIGYIHVHQLEQELYAVGYHNLYALQDKIMQLQEGTIQSFNVIDGTQLLVQEYMMGISTPIIGASGAIYGVLVGFGYLFPNTELMLLFPPIPIKAKWLVLIMIGIEVYSSFQNNPGDHTAHLAHLGGALVGFILVFIWQKKSKQFY